jgi:hypothetical protein
MNEDYESRVTELAEAVNKAIGDELLKGPMHAGGVLGALAITAAKTITHGFDSDHVDGAVKDFSEYVWRFVNEDSATVMALTH